MSENKINLVVPKDYNGTPIEVVLREGKAPVALDPKEPERVIISGTIDAPYRWLEKRVELCSLHNRVFLFLIRMNPLRSVSSNSGKSSFLISHSVS